MSYVDSQRLHEVEALAGTANGRDALALEQAVKDLLPLAHLGLLARDYTLARRTFIASTAPGVSVEAQCRFYELTSLCLERLFSEGESYVNANPEPVRA